MMPMDQKRLNTISQMADEIFAAIALDDKKIQAGRLRVAVDSMARVIGMLADVSLGHDRQVPDPLKYIEGKLSIAHQSITWKDPE